MKLPLSWLSEYVDISNISVDDLCKKFVNSGFEVEEVLDVNGETVLDIAVMPNRPDCNSIIGLAREAAAALGQKLKPLNANGKLDLGFDVTDKKVGDYVSVDVLDDKLCPRYMGAYVYDVKVGPSPDYIKSRLESMGLNSINNIVDITNYVLIETGQPMHAFDLRYLEGNKIIVRKAKSSEEITSLDGKVNKLDDKMLLICDAKKAVAIAGIMGGLNSGISDTTTEIVFESARFAKDSVRKTSRALNLTSDSQARFEKGVDFASQELGLRRALSLVSQLKAGKIASGMIDSLKNPPKNTVVKTSTKKINDILGIKIPDETISSILKNLEIENTVDKNGDLEAIIPLYREDVATANDLAEEVIRSYGYDKIVPTILDGLTQTLGGKRPEQKAQDKLKSILAGQGFNEIITFSFINKKAFDKLMLSQCDYRRNAIPLLNPLSEDFAVMRTTTCHSMLNIAAANLNKGVQDSIRLFECGKAYLPTELPLKELPNEQKRLTLFMCGGQDELDFISGAKVNTQADFYSIKGVIENILDVFGVDAKIRKSSEPYFHAGRSAEYYIQNNSQEIVLGAFGEIHPLVIKNYGIKDCRAMMAELNLEYILKNAVSIRKFVAPPKYPSIARDIALIVDDTILAQQVIDSIKKHSEDMPPVESIQIFDVYKGENLPKSKKSLAFSIVYRAPDRTLNDTEVKTALDKTLESVAKELNISLRQ